MSNLKFVRALMLFAAFAASIAGGAAQAAERSQVVDVTGIYSYNYYGEPGNTVLELDLGAAATVTSISWDFTFTSFSPSYLSEFEVYFVSSDRLNGLVFAPSDTFDWGTESHSGSANLVDIGLSFNVGADGKLLIEFADGFKDFDFGVAEGQWNSGSLTIGYDDHLAVTPVPEPETYAMMLLGLASVGAMARRRRKS